MDIVTIDTTVVMQRLRVAGFNENEVHRAIQALMMAHDDLAARQQLAAIEAKTDRLAWLLWLLIGLNALSLIKQFF